MLSESETALICDFAEYYHVLNWRGLPLETAAALAAGLRDDSRSVMQINKSKVQQNTALMALMADRLGLLLWSKTKDGQKNRNRPMSIFDALLDDKPKEKMKTYATGADFEAARRKILKGANNGN